MLSISTSAVADVRRLNELKTSLENRRRELMEDVHSRIRDVRSDYNRERDVLDPAESSEVDIQDEIGFALIQMKAETLNKIDTALLRIAEAITGTVSTAVTRSPKHASEPFRSLCDAKIVKKLARPRSRVNAAWLSVGIPQCSSPTGASRRGTATGRHRVVLR